MLDYYGSIIMNEDDIVKRIIDSYNGKYGQDSLKIIVKEFMDENKINRECSVSGWMVFFGKDAVKMVEERYLYLKKVEDAKKRLQFSKILNERLSPDKLGNQDPYLVDKILLL